MPAHIVTAAVFAPTATRTHLTSAHDPVFADGHTHMAPLSRTVSGASLGLVGVETRTTTFSEAAGSAPGDHEVLVPVMSRDGVTVPAGGAADAILVVADGASPFPCSPLREPASLTVRVGKQTRRASSLSSATRS